MKRLSLFAILALLAFQAEAQTVITVGGSCTGGVQRTTTVVQDGFALNAKLIDNAALCLAKGAAGGKDCSQAQLNAVAGCAAGACGTIYALTPGGTADYGLEQFFTCGYNVMGNKVAKPTAQAAASLILSNGPGTATNTECANAVGGTLGNGCTYAQIACRALSQGANSTCVASQ